MEAIILRGAASPVGWVTSFIDVPIEDLFTDDLAWRRSFGQVVEASEPLPYPECFGLLEPLETPWTRELLIDCGKWTAYLNNSIDGGDPTAAALVLVKRFNARCVTATNSPPNGPGQASTQLWLQGPDGDLPLMYVAERVENALVSGTIG